MDFDDSVLGPFPMPANCFVRIRMYEFEFLKKSNSYICPLKVVTDTLDLPVDIRVLDVTSTLLKSMPWKVPSSVSLVVVLVPTLMMSRSLRIFVLYSPSGLNSCLSNIFENTSFEIISFTSLVYLFLPWKMGPKR